MAFASLARQPSLFGLALKFRMDGVPEVHREQLFSHEAAELFCRGVHIAHLRSLEDEDRHAHSLGQGAELALAPPQRLLSALAIRDVPPVDVHVAGLWHRAEFHCERFLLACQLDFGRTGRGEYVGNNLVPLVWQTLAHFAFPCIQQEPGGAVGVLDETIRRDAQHRVRVLVREPRQPHNLLFRLLALDPLISQFFPPAC